MQVPSRLLVQVPRFGREFKTCQKIVPDLNLNITELTDSYTQGDLYMHISSPLRSVYDLVIIIHSLCMLYLMHNIMLPFSSTSSVLWCLLYTYNINFTAEVPECIFCGERSSRICTECQNEFKQVEFCDTCWTTAHRKKERAHHCPLPVVDVEVSELDLLSVICIETSHYVCFTRDPNSNSWIFFDSMANRLCEFLCHLYHTCFEVDCKCT